MKIKESPFIRCIQTGFMMLHTGLWQISEDYYSLKLVDMDLLKGGNKKLASAFSFSKGPTHPTTSIYLGTVA